MSMLKHQLAILAICLSTALLAGCSTKTLTVDRPVITYVDRPVACPSAVERERLRQLRPNALRNQPMPPTAVERNAQTQAQLGLYEAEGGYADQIDAALDRCQQP